jgi:GNAT superfamily N-acetyltransferase
MLIRFVELSDLLNGLLEVLNELADTSQLTLEQAKRAILSIRSRGNKYIVVAIKDDVVIGTGSIIIEEKLIHNHGFVGHIEDVVVSEKYRGENVGREIIKWLVDFAKTMDAYKVILSCAEHNVVFYEKCGFHSNCITMRKDLDARIPI